MSKNMNKKKVYNWWKEGKLCSGIAVDLVEWWRNMTGFFCNRCIFASVPVKNMISLSWGHDIEPFLIQIFFRHLFDRNLLKVYIFSLKQDWKGFQSHRLRNWWQINKLTTAWQLPDNCLGQCDKLKTLFSMKIWLKADNNKKNYGLMRLPYTCAKPKNKIPTIWFPPIPTQYNYYLYGELKLEQKFIRVAMPLCRRSKQKLHHSIASYFIPFNQVVGFWLLHSMAIPVMGFQAWGYKLKKNFA